METSWDRIWVESDHRRSKNFLVSQLEELEGIGKLTAQKLLKHFGIKARLQRLDDHAPPEVRARIIDEARRAPVALVSDAGTPLISDPGYRLVREARAAAVNVVSIPGACAAVSALSIAGLPSDRFLFAGFLPVKDKARAEVLEGLAASDWVVAAGVQILREGQQVRPVDRDNRNVELAAKE